jgi:hypothetical protein
VCCEIGLECIDYNPAKRPTATCVTERLQEMETRCSFVESDFCTSPITHVCLVLLIHSIVSSLASSFSIRITYIVTLFTIIVLRVDAYVHVQTKTVSSELQQVPAGTSSVVS